MKNFKLRTVILCLLFTAVFTVVSAQVQYAPGTYTGKALGRNNDVVVECTFDENSIVSISVISNAETPGVGDVPLKIIPEEIVKYQSLDVDLVAGATLSSFAVKNAVKDCVAQAGGDVKELESVPAEQYPAETVEKTADVIVVGAGGAGMSASLAALESGSSVILIETNGMVGGNTLVSGMAWNAVDPVLDAETDANEGQYKLLREFLEMDESDVEDFAPALKSLKEEINAYFAGDTSKVFDSVNLHVMQFWTGCRRQGLDGTWVKPDYELVRKFCENSMDTINWIKGYGVTFRPGIGTVTGGLWQRGHTVADRAGAFAAMQENVEKLGGDLMLNTHADSLIVENGKVVGVSATENGVTPVVLHANKGVVLACGGFGGNKVMADEYNNYWPAGLLNTRSDQIASTQGDGITMALAVGADTEGMGYTQLYPAVNIVTSDTGPLQGFGAINNLFINKEGKRFVNEYAERDVMSKAVLAQPDGQIYQIIDSDLLQYRLDNKIGPTQEMLDVFIRRGAFFKFETIEEMAAYIGCDAETLRTTLESYNTAVDNANDPLTGRTMFDDKCENAPYYVSPVAPFIHNTMGGLKINTDNAVLNTEGQPIPGLFAAGEVTGGLHAGNRLGGNAIGDCFTMGRNAGMSVAR